MGAFDFQCSTRVIAGPGAADQVGDVARTLGGTRALVCADTDTLSGGRAISLATSLDEHGIALVATVEVGSSEDAGAAERSAAASTDVLLALGGTAAFERARAIAGALPIIGLPTTASTGEGHSRCAALLLDPELSLDVPDVASRTAAIVAVGRAVEAWVTSSRSSLSDLFAREAWRQLASSYLRVASGPADAEAIGALLLGAFLSDVAASRSGLGALDACARPLSQRTAVGLGTVLAILLPEVVKWNTRVVADRYAELSAAGGAPRRPEALVSRLEDFVTTGGFPERLAQAGIPEAELPSLAERAAAEPSAAANPRKFDVAGALELYAATY
jgi:alcohol dehydrogenase class IV